MFVINRQRNLSWINKGYYWIVLGWLFLSNCYTRIVFGRHFWVFSVESEMGRNKETSLEGYNPNKQLSMFLHSLLYLDLNVGSAGLSLKADLFDGFCIFKTHQISRHFFLQIDEDVKRRQVSSCNWGSNEILQYKRFKVTIFESFERL